MSEPIKLNKQRKTMVVHSPREAVRLVRDEGWKIGDPRTAPTMVQQAARTAPTMVQQAARASESRPEAETETESSTS